MNINLPDFLIIPIQVIENTKLRAIDHRVYGYIYWLSKMRGQKCTAGNYLISKLAKAEVATIKKSLNRLEKQCIIKRIYNAKNERLEIMPLVVFSTSYPQGGSQLGYGGGSQLGYQNNNNNKNYYNNNKKIKKKPFFWGQEMRKVGDTWKVIPKDGGAWLEFAGDEKEIQWL